MQTQRKHATGGGTIAARIRAKRKAAGFSQSQAAEKWGVKKQTLQQWEQGRSRPCGLYLAHIEKILNK